MNDNTPIWKPTSVPLLYQHTPSGRYYTRFSVGGKRTFRTLKTNVWTVARTRNASLVATIEKQRDSLRAAQDRSWTTENWNPTQPWKGIPPEVWHLTIDLPPLMTVCRGIYLLGKNRELVYIGKAKNVHGRVVSHLDGSLAKDFDEVRVLPCLIGDRTPTSELTGLGLRRFEAIDRIEATLIRWLRPAYNQRVISSPTGESPEIEFRRWMDRINIRDLLAA